MGKKAREKEGIETETERNRERSQWLYETSQRAGKKRI